MTIRADHLRTEAEANEIRDYEQEYLDNVVMDRFKRLSEQAGKGYRDSPVRALLLAIVGGDGPVNLFSLGQAFQALGSVSQSISKATPKSPDSATHLPDSNQS